MSIERGAFLLAKTRFENTRDEVVGLVVRVNAIYEELSALNLNPSTMLYSGTTQFMTRTERADRGRIAVRDTGLHAKSLPRAARLPRPQLLSE
jgi:hypothetical protein